jgi:hypothetical protein
MVCFVFFPRKTFEIFNLIKLPLLAERGGIRQPRRAPPSIPPQRSKTPSFIESSRHQANPSIGTEGNRTKGAAGTMNQGENKSVDPVLSESYVYYV